MSTATVLQDRDLRLRPVSLPDDVTLALPWYQEPEMMWLSEGDAAARYDEGTVSKMYRYLLERGETYIIEIQTPDGWLPVGDAALCPDLIPIVIGVPEYRSQGLGSRILRLLVERARALGWRRIGVSGVYTYNPRARRLYERPACGCAGSGRKRASRTCGPLSCCCRKVLPRKAGAPPVSGGAGPNAEGSPCRSRHPGLSPSRQGHRTHSTAGWRICGAPNGAAR